MPKAKAPLPAVIDGAPTGGGGGAARKRKGKAAADGLAEKMASAAAMGGDDVDMDEGAGGKTLGERLRAIEQTAADLPVDARAPAEKQKLTATDRAVLDALGGKGAPPKADSLATLLSQALVAEDRALVERCLNVSDAQTVANTVARLQPHVAVRLLGAALDRMRTKPSRGEQLARWMRTVMLHHSGFITTSAKAQQAVMELQQTVEAHVAMQRPLLSLLGRLDLLLHKQQQVPDGEDGDGDGGEGPLTVYTEGEDDVNVLNEVVGNEESDDEWETDDEANDDEDDLDGFDDDDDDDDDDKGFWSYVARGSSGERRSSSSSPSSPPRRASSDSSDTYASIASPNHPRARLPSSSSAHTTDAHRASKAMALSRPSGHDAWSIATNARRAR